MSPEALSWPSLLAVCASLKPAKGRREPSACRELLGLALDPVRAVYPALETLDLRDARLPWFDGREPDEYDHPALAHTRARVEVAAAFVLSVPVYWGGIGAAFKNFVETVCGPGYDQGRRSPFAAKPAAVLLVGSDPRTADAGVPQVEAVLAALGVTLPHPPVVVSDPADMTDVKRAVHELTAAVASLVISFSVGMPAANTAKP